MSPENSSKTPRFEPTCNSENEQFANGVNMDPNLVSSIKVELPKRDHRLIREHWGPLINYLLSHTTQSVAVVASDASGGQDSRGAKGSVNVCALLRSASLPCRLVVQIVSNNSSLRGDTMSNQSNL